MVWKLCRNTDLELSLESREHCRQAEGIEESISAGGRARVPLGGKSWKRQRVLSVPPESYRLKTGTGVVPNCEDPWTTTWTGSFHVKNKNCVSFCINEIWSGGPVSFMQQSSCFWRRVLKAFYNSEHRLLSSGWGYPCRNDPWPRSAFTHLCSQSFYKLSTYHVPCSHFIRVLWYLNLQREIWFIAEI